MIHCPLSYVGGILDGESLDLVLEGADGAGELRALVGGDAASNDGAGDTAGTAKGGLGLDVNVGDVLVLGKEGKVENDRERVGVRSWSAKLASFRQQRSMGWPYRE